MQLVIFFQQVVNRFGCRLADIGPSLLPGTVTALLILGILQAGIDDLFDRVQVFFGKLLTDSRQRIKGPQAFIQPAGIIGCAVKRGVSVDDGLIKDQREVKDNAGEVGNQNIRAAQNLKVVVVCVPFQLIAVGIILLELLNQLLFRGKGLGMGADNW